MKINKSEIKDIENTLLGNKRKKNIFAGFKWIIFKLTSLLFLIFFRCIEILISSIVLCSLGLIVFTLLVIRKLFTGKGVFLKVNIIGLKSRKNVIFYFNCKNYIVKNISLFFYVITNKLSIVGVSIKIYDNVKRVAGDSYLYNNKPGIFNLWYIRQSARVTYEGQFSADWEYVFRSSLIVDLLIMLKSIPAFFYYFDPSMCRPKVNLFDLEFDNLTMVDAINKLEKTIESKEKKKVYFVNPDCLNKIFEDSDYFKVLKNGDYIFPDGIGVNIACKLLKDPLLENINGTDMLPFICDLSIMKSYSIFLLGGKPGIGDRMKCNLQTKYKGLKIVGVQDGYFDKEKENNCVIDRINSSGADILLVAFGAPVQEKWINEYSEFINAQIQMGVGGLFDFFSGKNKRAPKWMREVGIEWIFRIMQEPKRLWKRYVIGNPVFLYRVLKWKFSRYRN